MINEHLELFFDLPVEEWSDGIENFDPSKTAYRISTDWEDDLDAWTAKLENYLNHPSAEKTVALIVGNWAEASSGESSARIVQTLVSARTRLPKLKALFVGDITAEESEISWINQTDVSSLFTAFPLLEVFGVRGGDGLVLGRINHDNLKSLKVEAGGLPVAVVREIVSSNLPRLEHLEIWFGSSDYGGNATMDDVTPILSGNLFPQLKYLGLKNTEFADQLAEAYKTAPVLDRIDVLDISMSTLTDEGAMKLLENPRLKRLKKLDLHYHYISDEIQKKLQEIGIEVDLTDPQDCDEDQGNVYRYVACAE